jgi:mono/diheme cytochrome c family protein
LALAQRHLAAEEPTRAARWIGRAEGLQPRDPRIPLLRAATARKQGHADEWARQLDAAVAAGADAAALDRERELAALWAGADRAGTERRMTALAAAGEDPDEILAGVVSGCLATGDWRRAAHLLDVAGGPTDGVAGLLRARVEVAAGKTAEAEQRLRALLARRPATDTAHEVLVDLLADDGRLDDALAAARGWVARAGDDPTALVVLSRLLRRAGREEELAAIADRLGRHPAEAGFVERERAEVDLERGAAAVAGGRLETLAADGDRSAARRLPRPAASQPLLGETRAVAAALADDPVTAAALFHAVTVAEAGAAGQPPPARPAPPPDALYGRLCAACHGDGAEPRGTAAADLFPPPRDFRTDAFRLVSSPDGVPTVADVAAVIRRGIPGASMPAFADLADADIERLAGIVLALRLPAARLPRAATVARLPDAAELAAGDAARGRELYRSSGCAACHGADGTPDASRSLFDQRGIPNRPRDLVHEPMKGGDDPAALAARLGSGMPGSAHPAVALDPAALADLVAWVRSLAGPQRPPTTDHERLVEAAGPDALPAVPHLEGAGGGRVR